MVSKLWDTIASIRKLCFKNCLQFHDDFVIRSSQRSQTIAITSTVTEAVILPAKINLKKSRYSKSCGDMMILTQLFQAVVVRNKCER